MKINRLFLKISNWIFIIIVLLSIVYIVASHRAYKDNGFLFADGAIMEWNKGWNINLNGDVLSDVTLPVEVNANRGDSIILLNTLPDKIKEYNCIMLEGRRQDISVSIGGIQRECYSNKEYRQWGGSTPTGVVLVPLYNTDSLEDVAVHISSNSLFAGSIGKIYLGNEKSLMVMLLRKNIVSIYMTIIAFITGIICGVCYISYISSRLSKAMLYLALFAMLSSVWSFTNSDWRQFFISDLTTLEAIGYWAYMLLPLLLVRYVDWITEHRYRKILCACEIGVVADFVIENALLIFAKIGLYELRHASNTIYIIAVICAVGIAVTDTKKKQGVATRSLLIGSVGLLLGALGEILYNNISRAGEEHIMYISGALIFIGSGFIHNLLGAKREQQQIKYAESANLAQADFLASMSHEIITPMNTMIGMNEMIMRDSGDGDIREYSANISKAGKSLLALVDNILDYSRIEKGKLEIVKIEYVLKSTIEDMIAMAESLIGDKDIKLELNIDESLPQEYYGDIRRIKQVVSNLLSNAVKYTEKGKITLTIKGMEREANNLDMFFSVKDTGTGIKQEDIDRFKNSFVRIEEVRNSNVAGAGLGLSIVTKLLELMDSKLEVDSTVGEGSDFYFTIRQRVINDAEMGPVTTAPVKKSKKSKFTFTAPEVRVLAVDDNRMNLKVLAGILKATNIQVQLCESGKQCLELCKDNHYDIIFMDHMMPEMDGIETFKRLRADKGLQSSDSRVFVLTANTVSGAEQMYRECGFDYYLKKPINVRELNDVLIEFVAEEKILPVAAES